MNKRLKIATFVLAFLFTFSAFADDTAKMLFHNQTVSITASVRADDGDINGGGRLPYSCNPELEQCAPCDPLVYVCPPPQPGLRSSNTSPQLSGFPDNLGDLLTYYYASARTFF